MSMKFKYVLLTETKQTLEGRLAPHRKTLSQQKLILVWGLKIFFEEFNIEATEDFNNVASQNFDKEGKTEFNVRKAWDFPQQP